MLFTSFWQCQRDGVDSNYLEAVGQLSENANLVFFLGRRPFQLVRECVLLLSN